MYEEANSFSFLPLVSIISYQIIFRHHNYREHIRVKDQMTGSLRLVAAVALLPFVNSNVLNWIHVFIEHDNGHWRGYLHPLACHEVPINNRLSR